MQSTLPLVFGSLFTGIGGLDLGLERAGMQCGFQVEIDSFCQSILARHYPHVPRFGDIRTTSVANLPRVDVLAGGFPCQPHSLCGKRRGSSDERDGWGEYLRLIQGIKPRWVIAENVPGILSSENGEYFGRILEDLHESGYDAEWRCIAAAAHGAPHRRERVFLVAYPHGNGRFLRDGLFAGSACEPNPASHRDTWAGERGEPAQIGGRTYIPLGAGLRVADGIPERLDVAERKLIKARIKALGNAVVPQVAEYVGRIIVDAENHIRRNIK